MEQYILYEKRDTIGILTINRPNELNILSHATQAQMNQVLNGVEEDSSLRVLIITGAGDKAFMAGADIKELDARDYVVAREETRNRQKLYNRLWEMKIPVIAAVNGVAYGAGLELILGCTLRIAAQNAKLGAMEINLGIMPAEGGTQRLPRLIGFGRAMEMVLIGEPVDAERAYQIGLVNSVVPKEQLMEAALELAEKLARKAPLAIQCAKEAVNQSLEMGFYEGMSHESYLHAYLCATEDKKEGVAAFLEKRPPIFKGR